MFPLIRVTIWSAFSCFSFLFPLPFISFVLLCFPSISSTSSDPIFKYHLSMKCLTVPALSSMCRQTAACVCICVCVLLYIPGVVLLSLPHWGPPVLMLLLDSHHTLYLHMARVELYLQRFFGLLSVKLNSKGRGRAVTLIVISKVSGLESMSLKLLETLLNNLTAHQTTHSGEGRVHNFGIEIRRKAKGRKDNTGTILRWYFAQGECLEARTHALIVDLR